jgi:chlorite dismutase
MSKHSEFNPSERPPAGIGGPAAPRGRDTESADARGSSATTDLMNVDIHEYGGEKDGKRQQIDRRLFMQLLVFDCAPGGDPEETAQHLASALESAGVAGVVYEDVNDPRAIALLTWSENPDHFVTKVRPIFRGVDLSHLTLRPSFTMLGRSYSGGYEPDLEYWILKRPAETALNPDWPWAVWYPLRRSGEFAKLDAREQGKILKEHAIIGRAYGSKNLAHDIRLACHGLDANDNEFVIGLVGDNLHRLSHVVQTMRKTKQTSTYITQMGPFFVGRAAHRIAGR